MKMRDKIRVMREFLVKVSDLTANDPHALDEDNMLVMIRSLQDEARELLEEVS